MNVDTSALIPKRNRLNFLTLLLPFYLFNRNKAMHPKYFGVYYSWWNHQMHLGMRYDQQCKFFRVFRLSWDWAFLHSFASQTSQLLDKMLQITPILIPPEICRNCATILIFLRNYYWIALPAGPRIHVDGAALAPFQHMILMSIFNFQWFVLLALKISLSGMEQLCLKWREHGLLWCDG